MTRSRTLLILALAVAMMALPGLVITALGLGDLASVWTMGSTAGFVAMMAGGPRVAGPVAAALLMLTPVATWSSGSPWFGAVILAIAAAAAAYPVRWSRGTDTTWAVITLAFAAASPPSPGHGRGPCNAPPSPSRVSCWHSWWESWSRGAASSARGTVLLITAVVLRKRGIAHWRYAALMTLAIVLMGGADGAVVTTDVERLVATVVGRRSP